MKKRLRFFFYHVFYECAMRTHEITWGGAAGGFTALVIRGPEEHPEFVIRGPEFNGTHKWMQRRIVPAALRAH